MPRGGTEATLRPTAAEREDGIRDTTAVHTSLDSLTLADGYQIRLGGNDLRIGRAPTNDIVLDDEMIAAHHARLRRLPEGWLLTDLTGGGGSAVNDEPLTHPLVVAPGDAIVLGRLTLTLQAGDGGFGTAGQSVMDRRAGELWPDARGRPVSRTPASRMGPALIHLQHVVKAYGGRARPVPVLRGVGLSVQPGEFVAIVGPSGCGKSTLLNLITGIDRPDSGEVIVGGLDIANMQPAALTSWRGRAVGIVFQFFQLLPTLTVAENVMLPMAFCHTYHGHERRARALEVLAQVRMEHMADRLPSALSGGEQQRVAVARALANNPPIIVADEPTGNLDARTGRQVFELFAELVAAGTTVLMVTHDPALAASVPRRIEMLDGRIVGAG
jgi:putative ABC transport system ATP-binding protein